MILFACFKLHDYSDISIENLGKVLPSKYTLNKTKGIKICLHPDGI